MIRRPGNRPLFYILRDHKALPTDDVIKWGRMLEDTKARTVAWTLFNNSEPWITLDRQKMLDREAARVELGLRPHDIEQLRTHYARIMVSTVFLGLDHRWDSGPPLLFESMCFNGPLDEAQERYTTWEQAKKGHSEMVEAVKNAMVEEAVKAR